MTTTAEPIFPDELILRPTYRTRVIVNTFGCIAVSQQRSFNGQAEELVTVELSPEQARAVARQLQYFASVLPWSIEEPLEENGDAETSA